MIRLEKALGIGGSLSVPTDDALPIPQSGNIVFRADFNGTINASVGTNPTFVRASTVLAPTSNSETGYGTFTSGNPAIGTFPYQTNLPSGGGLTLYNRSKNWLLQSRTPGTTWALVAGAAANNATNTGIDGTATSCGDIVSLANGDGIEQDCGQVSASARTRFSVFVKVASGTLAGTLTTEGTGGTPETATQAFTATTAWQRVTLDRLFTAGATGNVKPKITAGAAGTLIVDQMQLEIHATTSPWAWSSWASPPITTTVAVVTTATDVLTIPAANFSTALSAGSMAIWAYVPSASYLGNGQVPALWYAVSGDEISFYFFTTDHLNATYNGTALGASASDDVAIGWGLYTLTWDRVGASYKYYRNTTNVATKNNVVGADMDNVNVDLGRGGSGINTLESTNSRCKVWNVVLSGTEVTALYNAERGYFGL